MSGLSGSPKQHHPLILPLGLLVCSIALQAMPASFSLLAWSPSAVADHQWWRWLTAPMVHYNWRHCLINTLMAALPLFIICRYSAAIACLLYLGSTLGTGFSLIYSRTDLQYFAGMSGFVIALWVYLLLIGQRSRRYKALSTVLLIFLGVKIVCEANHLTWLSTANPDYVIVWEAHAAGAAVAFLLFLFKFAVNEQEKPFHSRTAS